MIETEIEKFYEDDEEQDRYEKRVKSLVLEFKKKFKSFYDPIFHDDMIKQMARCEIAISKLERIIHNDKSIDDTPMKELQQHRQHLRSIWDQLQVSMKGQRGDRKNIAVSASDNFKDFMEENLMKMFDIEDEDKNEED